MASCAPRIAGGVDADGAALPSVAWTGRARARARRHDASRSRAAGQMPSAASRPSSSTACRRAAWRRPPAVAPRVGQGAGLGVADRPPHPLGRARHVEVADAEVGEGVDDGVLHGRRRADRRRLADALGAERVERRRRLGRVDLEARQLGGGRDRRSRRGWPSAGCRRRRGGPPRTAPGRCRRRRRRAAGPRRAAG